MFRSYCIQNVKNGIQLQVYSINNESVKHVSQFISVKVKKNLRKSQAQVREKLRKLGLRQNDGFLMKKTCSWLKKLYRFVGSTFEENANVSNMPPSNKPPTKNSFLQISLWVVIRGFTKFLWQKMTYIFQWYLKCSVDGMMQSTITRKTYFYGSWRLNFRCSHNQRLVWHSVYFRIHLLTNLLELYLQIKILND